MEFKHLQSFVAVVKYGSFTKAAEKLFLSQPTISAHISALEEELDKLLIVRTTKSIEVTSAGQAVYEYAMNILDLKERMTNACKEEEQRVIYLGVSSIPSAYVLPEILPEFGRLHKDTYFVIDQSDSQGVIDGLLDGIFDIGFIGMNAEEKLVCEPFCQDHMVIITPFEEKYRNMPFTELLKEPIIIREDGSASGKSALQLLEKLGLSEEQLHVTARINDLETIKNLVAGGFGISIISEKAVRNFVEEKRLLQFELPVQSNRYLYLAYRKNYEMKPYVQEFVRFVQGKY